MCSFFIYSYLNIIINCVLNVRVLKKENATNCKVGETRVEICKETLKKGFPKISAHGE